MNLNDYLPQEPLSTDNYDCHYVACKGCQEPVLIFASTIYPLYIGVEHGFPKELSFATTKDLTIGESEADSVYRNHFMFTGQSLFCKCQCGGRTEIFLTEDGGFMDLLHGAKNAYGLHIASTISRSIPGEIVPFLTTPKEGWMTGDAIVKGSL